MYKGGRELGAVQGREGGSWVLCVWEGGRELVLCVWEGGRELVLCVWEGGRELGGVT